MAKATHRAVISVVAFGLLLLFAPRSGQAQTDTVDGGEVLNILVYADSNTRTELTRPAMMLAEHVAAEVD